MGFQRIIDFWRKPELMYQDKYAYTGILLLTHLIYVKIRLDQIKSIRLFEIFILVDEFNAFRPDFC